LCYQAEVFATG